MIRQTRSINTIRPLADTLLSNLIVVSHINMSVLTILDILSVKTTHIPRQSDLGKLIPVSLFAIVIVLSMYTSGVDVYALTNRAGCMCRKYYSTQLQYDKVLCAYIYAIHITYCVYLMQALFTAPTLIGFSICSVDTREHTVQAAHLSQSVVPPCACRNSKIYMYRSQVAVMRQPKFSNPKLMLWYAPNCVSQGTPTKQASSSRQSIFSMVVHRQGVIVVLMQAMILFCLEYRTPAISTQGNTRCNYTVSTRCAHIRLLCTYVDDQVAASPVFVINRHHYLGNVVTLVCLIMITTMFLSGQVRSNWYCSVCSVAEYPVFVCFSCVLRYLKTH